MAAIKENQIPLINMSSLGLSNRVTDDSVMASEVSLFDFLHERKEKQSNHSLILFRNIKLSDIRGQLNLLTDLCKSILLTNKASTPFNFANSPPAYKSPLSTPRTRALTLTSSDSLKENIIKTRFDLPNLWCVIPAGGSGTRLWPLSRDSIPKFLLDLEGSGDTLLQSTVKRLNELTPNIQTLIVTGKKHKESVLTQLTQVPISNILSEPCPKDSMAALALAAADILQRDEDAIIASFPADHLIRTNDDNFYEAVIKAYEIAKQTNRLVTIGLHPTFASTAFGYIHKGSIIDQQGKEDIYTVNSFKEKPNQSIASEFIASGNYVWNAGMFVCKARTLLQMLQEHHNELFTGINEINRLSTESKNLNGLQKDKIEKEIEKLWNNLASISIDHAIAEPVAAQHRMAVVCASLDWKDVGDFASLSEIHNKANDEIRVLGDTSLIQATDSTGFFVPLSGRLIACHGLKDIAIIDTPDALLVTTTAEAQNIKKLVGKCKKAFDFVS